MKVLTVVGARPQFIKMFPVSRAIREAHEEVIVHTGQHYDEGLSEVFFDELEIPEPDYNLGVGSDSHGRQTAAMLMGIEEILGTEQPDVVLVYGDTNSTLSGAIAASKHDALLAHVEAGLRSYNRDMPEEINRVLTDHASDLLFAPSETAVETLKNEGIIEGVHFVGDVMYDAILRARDIADGRSKTLDQLGYAPGQFVLATVHRAGNTDNRDRLSSIIEGLVAAEKPVVLPLHPRTEEQLKLFDLWDQANSEIEIIDPVGYLDFVRLVDTASVIATDSGGVQKEAFYLDTPCVTLREETEWLETIDSGWNALVGADQPAITEALRNPMVPETKPTPYGEGTAAEHIIELLEEELIDKSTLRKSNAR